MLKRKELGTGRTRYTVHRPQWPTVVVTEAAYVVVASMSGAGAITLLLVYLGVV